MSSSRDLIDFFGSIQPIIYSENSQLEQFSVNPYTLELVPKISFMGRVWEWYFFIESLIFRKNFEFEKKIQVLEKIERQYRLAITAIQNLHKRVSTALTCEGSSFYQVIREFLEVAEACPFLDHCTTRNSTAKAVDTLQNLFLKERGIELIPEVDVRVIQTFTEDHSLALLTSATQKAVPIILLQKIASNVFLDADEELEITNWIDSINQCSHLLSHLVLYRSLECLKLSHFPKLICYLVSKGCSPLLTKDKVWDSSLRLLRSNAKLNAEYTLSEEIYDKELFELNLRLFAIKEDSSKAALFGGMPSSLIQLKAANEDAWGLPPVRVHKVDAQGLYWIIEKPKYALSQHKWKTPDYGSIRQEDIPLAKELSRYIEWLSVNKINPKQFSIKHIYFTSDNKLVTLSPIRRESSSYPFEYCKLEEFVKDLSLSNHILFRYIMRESLLYKHPVAKYIVTVIHSGPRDEIDFTAEDIADKDTIPDPFAVERAKKNYTYYRRLAEELTIDIEKGGSEIEPAQIAKAIERYMDDILCRATIWPSTKEAISQYLKKYIIRPQVNLAATSKEPTSLRLFGL